VSLRCRLALAAGLLAGSAGQADAIELLTGDGYLLALAQDEAARKSADDYLAGTLDELVVINEVTATEENRMFCLSTERADVLDNALLRQEFTKWLRDAPSIAVDGQDPNGLPLSVLGWVFLDSKFPCAEAEGNTLGDDVRKRLLDSVPKR
jgi:hypothetical protein